MSLMRLYIDSYRGFSHHTWKLMLPVFILSLCQMLFLFLALYIQSLYHSIHLSALAASLFGFGSILAGLCAGFVAQRLGCKRTIIISLIFNALVTTGMLLTQRLEILLLIAFLTGLFANLARPIMIALIAESVSSQECARVFSLRRLMMNLGCGIATVIGAWIASYSFLIIFCIDIFASLLAAYCFYKLLSESTANQHSNSHRKSPTQFSVRFILLCFIILIGASMFDQLRTAYPIYLQTILLLNTSTISLLFAVSTLFILLFEMPIQSGCKSIGSENLSCAGIFFLGFGLAAIPFCSNSFELSLSVICWTLGELLFFPNMLSQVVTVTQDTHGKYIGIYQACYSASVVTAPMAGTFIYTTAGPDVLWATCGIVSIVMMLMIKIPNQYSQDFKQQK